VHTKIISEADVQLVEVAPKAHTVALNLHATPTAPVDRPLTLIAEQATTPHQASPMLVSPTPSSGSISRIPVLKTSITSNSSLTTPTSGASRLRSPSQRRQIVTLTTTAAIVQKPAVTPAAGANTSTPPKIVTSQSRIPSITRRFNKK